MTSINPTRGKLRPYQDGARLPLDNALKEPEDTEATGTDPASNPKGMKEGGAHA